MKADWSPELADLRRRFRIFYQQELQAFFAPMEAERKKYLRRFWMLLFITFFVMPLAIVFILTFTSDNVEFILAIFAISAAVCSAPILSYKKHVKGNIMAKMVNFFGDFSYSHENIIDWEILEESKLFSEPTSHTGDDYIHGQYKNVGITISEETHKTKQGKNTLTTFSGIIILLDMDKAFTGKTIVRKDKGWLLNKCNRLGVKNLGQRVVLEDVVFEKHFEAYSNDQIEARYLLTTGFMERMLQVRNAFKGDWIQFSFFDNKLLMAIDTDEDMFETSSLFHSATDYNRIEKAFDQFCSVFAVVDILKLNRGAN